MRQLENRTALVTGATSPVGRAVTARLIDEGAHVFATVVGAAGVDALAREFGSAVVVTDTDTANLDDLDAVYRSVAYRGLGLDVLVVNTEGGRPARLEELDPDDFDRTFGADVRGTVFAVQKALPYLNAGASVVLTGSRSPIRAAEAGGVDSASKAALREFARIWAIELAGRGVRVNTVVIPDEANARTDAVDALLFLVCGNSGLVTGSELFVGSGPSR